MLRLHSTLNSNETFVSRLGALDADEPSALPVKSVEFIAVKAFSTLLSQSAKQAFRIGNFNKIRSFYLWRESV